MTTDAQAPDADAASGRRSIVDTWTEVIADAGGLIRAEASMARLETGQNVRAFGRQAAKLGAGAVLMGVMIVALSVAAIVALAHFVGLLPALLIVALLCGIIGMLLIRAGADALASQRLLPERTLSRMSRDLERISAQGAPLDLPEVAPADGAAGGKVGA